MIHLDFWVQIFSETGGILLFIVLLIASYFMGNINPAIILGRIYGVDVRKEGSGNAGTTNALRTIGKKAGAIVFLVDVLKGFLPVLIIAHFLSLPTGMICGVATILGHMWPAVFGFRGGKGVATTFGVLLAVEPLLALVLIAIVLISVLLFRMVSLGVMLAALVAVPLSYVFDTNYPLWMLCIALLVCFKHRGNIVRILKGTESKFSIKKNEKETGR